MKAIVQRGYGGPESLELREVDRPAIGSNEVLVGVRAASIHLGDWILMKGEPYVLRLASGLRKPKQAVPGTDVAGTVEAVGSGVTSLRPGDAVFGWGDGAFAEYAVVPEDQLLPMPANLTFEQAAAVGVSATTALQLLRDNGSVRAGQRVLIYGASGGVGTFAVQIAKSFGAEVTGVCGTANVALVRSIGADHVIDYTAQDVTRSGHRYDLILDNVGNRSLGDLRRALAPGGILLPNGGGHRSGRWIGILGSVVKASLASVVMPGVGRPSTKFANRSDLIVLKQLVETGKVRPVIGGTYPLSATRAAVERVGAGHAGGTMVISMPSASVSSASVATMPSVESAA